MRSSWCALGCVDALARSARGRAGMPGDARRGWSGVRRRGWRSRWPRTWRGGAWSWRAAWRTSTRSSRCPNLSRFFLVSSPNHALCLSPAWRSARAGAECCGLCAELTACVLRADDGRGWGRGGDGGRDAGYAGGCGAGGCDGM
eukprot:2027941-Rhodomonas_salina.1